MAVVYLVPTMSSKMKSGSIYHTKLFSRHSIHHTSFLGEGGSTLEIENAKNNTDKFGSAIRAYDAAYGRSEAGYVFSARLEDLMCVDVSTTIKER